VIDLKNGVLGAAATAVATPEAVTFKDAEPDGGTSVDVERFPAWQCFVAALARTPCVYAAWISAVGLVHRASEFGAAPSALMAILTSLRRISDPVFERSRT
jgi:hypothetical protein